LELTGGTANEVNFSCSNLTNPRNLRRWLVGRYGAVSTSSSDKPFC
jgi:hypothetical protein